MSAQVLQFKTKEQKEKESVQEIMDKIDKLALAILKEQGVEMPAEYEWYLDMEKKMKENFNIINSFSETELNKYVEIGKFALNFNVTKLMVTMMVTE